MGRHCCVWNLPTVILMPDVAKQSFHEDTLYLRWCRTWQYHNSLEALKMAEYQQQKGPGCILMYQPGELLCATRTVASVRTVSRGDGLGNYKGTSRGGVVVSDFKPRYFLWDCSAVHLCTLRVFLMARVNCCPIRPFSVWMCGLWFGSPHYWIKKKKGLRSLALKNSFLVFVIYFFAFAKRLFLIAWNSTLGEQRKYFLFNRLTDSLPQ